MKHGPSFLDFNQTILSSTAVGYLIPLWATAFHLRMVDIILLPPLEQRLIDGLPLTTRYPNCLTPVKERSLGS
jgi:hypothetical protein